MPDGLDELAKFARETIDELLRTLPAERRLRGVSAGELWDALSPEMRAELAQRLTDRGSRKGPGLGATERGEGKE